MTNTPQQSEGLPPPLCSFKALTPIINSTNFTHECLSVTLSHCLRAGSSAARTAVLTFTSHRCLPCRGAALQPQPWMLSGRPRPHRRPCLSHRCTPSSFPPLCSLYRPTGSHRPRGRPSVRSRPRGPPPPGRGPTPASPHGSRLPASGRRHLGPGGAAERLPSASIGA